MPSAPATLPAARLDRARTLRRRSPLALGWERLGPVAAACLLAAVYLILHPRTVDLAAHTYRAGLFGREGFTIWDGFWYGGHHTPAYSVLFPPLAWLLGPSVLGVISAVTVAALFERLARARYGVAARWGALWLGLATGTLLFTGRLTFALGVAIGLAALLAFQRGRHVIAAGLATGCALASPVAGLFLALAAAAHAIADRRARARAAMLGLAAVLPPLLLAVAFPEGGWEPFALIAAFAVLPRSERSLRVGLALYGVAGIATYAIHTPMGSNVVRLGALFGGPVIACAIAGRPPRRRAVIAFLAAGFAALALWQWSPAFRDTAKAVEDPVTAASYYTPLIHELERQGGPPGRLEIPFTQGHWEAAEVAAHYPLARGWERQLDIQRDGIFYGGVLNRITYAAWLAEHGVRFVALASGKPDYSSIRERALIEAGLPYLKLIWRSKDWRLYEFTLPHPLVVPDQGTDMRLLSIGPDDSTLDVRRPGSAVVKVAWSPYWAADGACVQRDGEWTRVSARRPGRLRLVIAFSLERVFDHGRRCS